MSAWPAPALDADVERRLLAIGNAELVVGIPSVRNGATIAHVAEAAHAGLARYFPGRSAVLVNSDGGSEDGTPQAFEGAPAPADGSGASVVRLPLRYRGPSGKGTAFRSIFHVAARLGARACAVVDADLRSIEPAWFGRLLGPVLEDGVDFVAPLYARHKFDGTITNSIVYPLTRALYGVRIRQPIGGDFGFSARLARHWLAQDVWSTDVARFGIDVWLTTTAVAGGFKTAQAFLGAKIHDPKDPGQHLAGMLVQVVGTQFRLMDTYAGLWRERPSIRVPRVYGDPRPVPLEHVHADVDGMTARFTQGVHDLAAIHDAAMTAETARTVRAIAAAAGPGAPPVFHDAPWARVVCDFAVAHHRRRMPAELLLSALVPLYLGRVASFVAFHESSDPSAVEDAIESLCAAFDAERAAMATHWEDAS